MTTDDRDQPTPREILDAVLHSQDILANAIGRMAIDVGSVQSDVSTLKADVGTIKNDIQRLEHRVVRIDDRLAVIENINLGPVLADHERRLARLEGLERPM